MTGVSVAGVVSYETDYGILLMSVCQNSPQGGEVVRKVKHPSVRIENPLLAMYRGLGLSVFPLTPPEMSVSSAPAGQSYKQKDLLNFSKSLNSYWVRESNPYCKIENLEY